jgi:alpha-L-fucosidase
MLYAHILERGVGAINIEGMNGMLKSAVCLHDGSEVNIDRPWNAPDNMEDAFLNLSTYRLPSDEDTVVRIELK